MTDARLGGWAWANKRDRWLAHIPTGEVRSHAYDVGRPEPAYAAVDAWTPPHDLALPAQLCVALRRAAVGVEPRNAGPADYFYAPIPAALEGEVVDRFREANSLWWGLDVDAWAVRLKRYRVGDHMAAHTDMYAGSALRKLAGTVQLSRPSEYDGGALVVHHWGERLPMPNDLGALVVFPGWVTHEVEPVTRGERWVLLVNGYGPPLR